MAVFSKSELLTCIRSDESEKGKELIRALSPIGGVIWISAEQLLLLLFYAIVHMLVYDGIFVQVMSDDLEFGHHKKNGLLYQMTHGKGIADKIFFVSMRKYIKRAHYYLFIFNNLSFLPLWIFSLIYVLSNGVYGRIGATGSVIVYLISACIVGSSRRRLYRGNKVHSRKSYRE